MNKLLMIETRRQLLTCDPEFCEGVLILQVGFDESWLTVDQVKDLVSHLQRALDEHGDKTQ